MKTTKLSLVVRVVVALAVIAFSLTVRAQAQTLKVLHSFTGKWDGGAPYSGVMFDSTGNLYGTTTTGGNPNTCTAYGGCGVVYKLSLTSSGVWQETPILRFTSSATGATPEGNLVMDSSGNILGTDSVGGGAPLCAGAVQGCGLVYELSPSSTGAWQETVPQIFDNGSDGGFPYDGLVADTAGNFYGTTSDGGNAIYCQGFGCGVVFELSPTSSGGWQEHILYSFTGGSDGSAPFVHLIFDAAGNLYGTAASGGNLNACFGQGCGVVFELSPSDTGAWAQKVLHTFSGKGDGSGPYGALAFDGTGNLYGTTYFGGITADCSGSGCGVVFKLAPSGNTWNETVLHTFTGGVDGRNPGAGVVLDATRNVYGTTFYGGNLNDCSNIGCGVIFKLASNSSGRWQESVLHSFTDGADGGVPLGPLIFGPDGNLYGTTGQGGMGGAGVVFKIAP